MQSLTPRIKILELLIAAFSRPSQSMVLEILEGDFPARIVSCCRQSSRCCFPPGLVEEIRKLPEEFQKQDPGEILTALEIEYLRLFVNDFPSVWAQPYESWYQEGRTMGKAALDCLALYQENGLKTVEGGQLPDHLVTQLEYLLFLALLEKRALSEKDTVLCGEARAQGQHFYERHVMTWFPSFCAEVQANSRVSFYRVMARLLKNYIVQENRNLHLHQFCFDEGAAHGYKIA